METRFDLQSVTQRRSAGVFAAAVFLLLIVASGCQSVASVFSRSTPPEPPTPREFRAAWIATVANIDWPSKPGLHSSEQKAELRALLDRAVALNLNAVILQVRPAADALYVSDMEPWSEFLSGTMGQAPYPFYDPLAFAVEEAHKRGLELHAWFNPFRAHHPVSKSPISDDHVSRTHPNWVVAYGDYLWIDPGFPDARRFSLDVIMDVVRRYDIDGVHMDDYFYPYQITDSTETVIPFPDVPSYAIAVASGRADSLTLNDWRRANVNDFVATLYEEVKSAKPWVKVGISPFGIWRPGYPEQIKGYDAYDRLYADSRKWLNEGWVDYFSPQLYWSIESTGQSYPVLLDWWRGQNFKNRHLWPGNFTSRVIATNATVWEPEEIVEQVDVTRNRLTDAGNIHFSMKSLVAHPTGMGRELEAGPYSNQAVIPASPWLSDIRPATPSIAWDDLEDENILRLLPGSRDEVWLWVIKTRFGYNWSTQVIPGWMQTVEVSSRRGSRPDAVYVRAVNKYGSESLPATIARSDS